MEKKKMHYAWWILVSCCALVFGIMGISLNTIGIFVGPVLQELKVPAATLMLYITILQLVMAAFLPFAGKIINKVNFNLLISICTLVFSAAFIVMSQGHSVINWYIAGVMFGLAGPFVLYLTVAPLLSVWFKKNLGTAMGITFSFSGIGGAVLSPVGAYIIQNYGWRTTYIVFGILISAICLPFTIFVIRRKPSDMGLLPYGAEEVQTQTAAKSVELDGVPAKAAMKMPAFYLAAIFIGFITFAMAINTQLPFYAGTLGYAPMIGATLVSAVMLSNIGGKVVLGILNDKMGIQSTSSIAVLCGALSMGSLLFGKTNILFLYIGAVLFGVAYAILNVQVPLVLKQIFGLKSFNEIFSYMSSFGSILSALSAVILGYVYDMTKSYFVAIVIILIGYVVALISVNVAMNMGKKLQKPLTAEKTQA